MDHELEVRSRVDLRGRVEDLLEPGRSVTLTGTGGMGKTWLARRLEADTATFVDCVAARSRGDLLRSLADASGCHHGGGDVATFARTVVENCGLVVLDNLEQVLEPARQVVDALVDAGGRVLCTSRTPLDGLREQVVELAPLEHDEALAFFRRRVDPFTRSPDDDPDEHALVRYLGGNPLALEIAAAHTRLSTAKQLLDHLEGRGDLADLRDRPDRHRSLSAVGEHTWNLLQEPERRALRVLGCLEGTFTLEVARRVGVEARTLDALIRWSLVKRERAGATVRLLLPAVLRGWLRTEHPADVPERTAVARWAVEEGTRAASGFGCVGEERCMNRAAALYPDLVNTVSDTALPPSLRAGALVVATRFLGARHQHQAADLLRRNRDVVPERDADRVVLIVQQARSFRRLGRQDEGLDVIDRALAGSWSPEDEGSLRIERSFQLAHGRQVGGAHIEAERAAALLEGRGTMAEALALRQLGVGYRLAGRQQEARRALERAVSLSRAGGFVLNEVTALSQLMQLDQLFDVEAIEALYRQGLVAAERSGRLELLALLQGQYATRMLWEGEVERVDPLLDTTVAVFRRIGLRTAADNLACRRALALAPEPSIPEARDALGSLLDEVRRAQVSHYEGEILAVLAALHHLEGAHDEARAGYASAARRASEIGHHQAGVLLASLVAVLDAEQAGTEPDPDVWNGFAGYLGRLRGALQARLSRAPTQWVFQSDGRAFLAPDGERVGLGRRQGSRRVLVALVEARVDSPGRSLTTDELFAQGWPGQTIQHASAQARLWTAIRDLRSLGLQDLLQTSGDGYRLDPDVPVRKHDDLAR